MTAVAREDIQPLDLGQALKAYEAHVRKLTDAQFAVEKARIEATPCGLVHGVVDDDADRRALVAVMASPVRFSRDGDRLVVTR